MRILGPLQVEAGGQTIEVGGARLRALLIRLALDPGRVVPVESLVAALWADAGGPTDPTHAVQALVARLRRVLPQRSALQSVAGGYRIDVPVDAVDALRFEALAADGRRALRDDQPARAARLLREALALWRGDALADAGEAPFAAPAAARLAELRLSAIEDRIAADLAGRAEPARLVAELEELTGTHPLRERMRTLLVQALAAAGRPAEALAAYQAYRARLADELGADPGPELQRVHLAVLRGEPAAPQPAAPQPTVPPERSNLPVPLTDLVGRIDERTRLAKQLADARLVTLTGPGGVGKTRLANAVATALTDDLPGGVWLVELAAVSDPADLVPAVTGAVGLRDRRLPDAPAAARDPLSRLVEALAGDPALIVLDNCEHLVDAVAKLADRLLSRCPRLRVLATSREPLGIAGETLAPLSPLPAPAPGTPAVDARGYPAVRLFAERAAAVRPGFAVTDGNVEAVVEICHRLDGLPLAIELAAARVRSLPVEQVAAGLDDRFRLLRGGSRTAAPRHRALAAVVAWSWDLLDQRERRLAERLSVFPGSFSPPAAAEVGSPRTSEADVLDLLAGLVDRSLLQLLDGHPPRYRMLETIREYGRQRLAEAGELDGARVSHARYFLRLAEAAAPHLRGSDQPSWMVALAAERDNLLAALHLARDHGDADLALRLAGALSHFWTVQGNHAEAADWLDQALRIPNPAATAGPPRTAAVAGYLWNTAMSDGRAVATVDEIRAMSAGIDASAPVPGAALIEPLLALIADEPAAGLAATATLSDLDPWTAAMLQLVRSFLHGNHGDIDGLRRELIRAAGGFRAIGERWGLATSLTFLAHTQITLGEFADAEAGLTEAIGLLRELDPGDDTILQRVLLAAALAQRGDTDAARARLRELVESTGRGGSARFRVLPRLSLGDLARLDGDLAEAARQYRAAEQELDRLPFDAPLLWAMLRCATGHLAIGRGDLPRARRDLAEALSLALHLPDLPIAAAIGVAVARWRFREGAAGPAAELLGAAHALRGAPDAFDPDVVRLAGELAEALGERAFRSGYERGRRLGRDGALALVEAQVRRR